MNLILYIVKLILILIIVLIFLLPILIISIIIKLESKGPVIHWSKRIGLNNKIFLMPKFRTMKINTINVATHLLVDSDNHITKFGKFLRKTSLDEFPQFFSILKLDMNFVGPRPALFNQDDLISLRTIKDIHKIRPGITGLAQINGRDNISIEEKIDLDELYLIEKSHLMNIKIILLTIFSIFNFKNIKH